MIQDANGAKKSKNSMSTSQREQHSQAPPSTKLCKYPLNVPEYAVLSIPLKK